MAKRRRPATRKRDYKVEYARRKKYGKPRDYKKEYEQRRARELKKLVEEDARRVFGRKPKRDDRHPDPLTYEDYLIDRKKRDGRFDWTDEGAFIAAVTGLGLTANEAYTLWFSP